MRCHLILVRMAKVKSNNSILTVLRAHCEQEDKIVQIPWKSVQRLPKTLKIELPPNPAIYLASNETYI